VRILGPHQFPHGFVAGAGFGDFGIAEIMRKQGPEPFLDHRMVIRYQYFFLHRPGLVHDGWLHWVKKTLNRLFNYVGLAKILLYFNTFHLFGIINNYSSRFGMNRAFTDILLQGASMNAASFGG
jgi:hypothetical protein